MGLVAESKSKILSFVPVTDTSAYASGDQIGSITELTNAMDDQSGYGQIISVALVDADKQAQALELLFFKQKPVVASVDQGALDISDSEMASNFVGSIKIATTDYTALNSNSIASVKGQFLIVQSLKGGSDLTGRSLWVILRSSGTPTYTTAAGLQFRIGIKQD